MTNLISSTNSCIMTTNKICQMRMDFLRMKLSLRLCNQWKRSGQYLRENLPNLIVGIVRTAQTKTYLFSFADISISAIWIETSRSVQYGCSRQAQRSQKCIRRLSTQATMVYEQRYGEQHDSFLSASRSMQLSMSGQNCWDSGPDNSLLFQHAHSCRPRCYQG